VKAADGTKNADETSKNTGTTQQQKIRTNNRKKITQDDNTEEEWVKKQVSEKKSHSKSDEH